MVRSKWRKPMFAVVLLCGGVLVTSCAPASGGGASGDTTDDPFDVLVVVTTSGGYGVFGNGVVHGAQAAANVLNEDGGILGRDVQVTVADMAGDAAKGVTLLQQAFSSGQTPEMAFVGLVGSDALAMSPITTQNDVLSFTYTSVVDVHQDTEAYPFSFSVVPPVEWLGGMPADAVWADGHKEVVTVTSNTESGADYVAAFTSRFEELGGEVTEAITTEPGAADLTADYNRAYAADPDAIYASVQGQGAASLKANYAAGGQIPLYGDIGLSHDFRSQGATDAELANVTGAAQPIRLTTPERRTDAQQTFIEAWQALEPDDNESSANAAAGYDAVMATAAAAEQAGTADAVAVSAALEDLHGDATWASGYRFTYTKDDHQVAVPKAGSGGVPPAVSFPLAVPYVASDGGYFEYAGSLTQE